VLHSFQRSASLGNALSEFRLGGVLTSDWRALVPFCSVGRSHVHRLDQEVNS
jgi:hypothetical protein